MNFKRNTVWRAGFTLIEVLVATLLLIIIVLVVSMVFRQSSIAWDSGIERTEGAMAVRAAVGALQRDLRNAVDGRAYSDWGSGSGFSASSTVLDFIALVEPSDDDLVDGGSAPLEKRTEPVRIKYEAVGNTLKRGESKTLGAPPTTADMLPRSAGDKYKPSFSFDGVNDPDDPGGLPLYVEIKVELETQQSQYGLEVRSFGRNGVNDDKGGDDIVAK